MAKRFDASLDLKEKINTPCNTETVNRVKHFYESHEARSCL